MLIPQSIQLLKLSAIAPTLWLQDCWQRGILHTHSIKARRATCRLCAIPSCFSTLPRPSRCIRPVANFLKLGSSREGLETAVTFLADRLAFERRQLPQVPKMNDVSVDSHMSLMARSEKLDPSELKMLAAGDASIIVSPDEIRREHETDSYGFDM